VARQKSPLLRKRNPHLQKNSLFVLSRTALPRPTVRPRQGNLTAYQPPRVARPLNQLIKLGRLQLLQGEPSLIRANRMPALPAARSSVLSIPYPEHTRLLKDGGARAGSKIGLPS
jgi:hypothetical protein